MALAHTCILSNQAIDIRYCAVGFFECSSIIVSRKYACRDDTKTSATGQDQEDSDIAASSSEPKTQLPWKQKKSLNVFGLFRRHEEITWRSRSKWGDFGFPKTGDRFKPNGRPKGKKTPSTWLRHLWSIMKDYVICFLSIKCYAAPSRNHSRALDLHSLAWTWPCVDPRVVDCDDS